ncbi:type II secretion system F family protein [Herbaspirillum sp. RV1423]|uniref:type II secretion system F family protein n=1 Tax=Herbaspirillum sp. RV1423 TaxID=1443993 RepID=UPI0004B96DC5|nr:type II secretion system F family protein [Herbaspirillum sp. RV1423]
MTWQESLIFLPVALFSLGYGYVLWRRRQQLTSRMHRLGVHGNRPLHADWIVALAAPLAGAKERQRLTKRLINAGWSGKQALDLFLLAKLGVFMLALLLGWLWLDINIAHPLAHPFALFKLLVLLYVSVRLPDWWLTDRASTRRLRIRAGVPQAIDLLTVCAEAGLSMEDAFGRVAKEIASSAPEVSMELRQTASELLVMPDRVDALRRLDERTDVQELEHLSSVLIQSTRFGTPLADAMRSIAADGRVRQISALEEKAGKLAAGMGVPLIVLVLFPLVVLMTAPPVVNLMRTLSKAAS